MKKRNDKIKAEQDMMIDMDPEIAEIFRASQSVSGKCHDLASHHVVSHHLYLTNLIFCIRSVKGKFIPSNEGDCQEKTHQGGGERGEEDGVERSS